MRSLSSLVMLAMLLAGCASSRDVRLADGWMAHVVSCGGPLLNMGHCVEKAGAVCGGRGYRILNATGGELPATPNAIPTGGLPHMPTSGLSDFAERKLFIMCN
ncbi:MAG: hypothetical protein H6935_00325 [Thiobacillus sp.]|nr:hypothetical protein [Thiobacillus sp.]